MDKYFLDNNLILLLPASFIFILLVIHCYWYRGARLTFTFFGSVLVLSFGREALFYFFGSLPVKPPYQVIGATFKIFNLPLVLYIGWAITFYLSWCLAERILKRIGSLSKMIFPTIIWSILIAGAISYCVEATGTRAGWWAWSFSDTRFKDFLVAPFSAFEGWSAETALFLLVFFLLECSKFRSQWWKVFLYPALFFNITLNIIMYCIVLLSRNNSDPAKNIKIFVGIFDSLRLLLPVILMFLWPVSFKYGSLDERKPESLFLHDSIPLLALFAILSICIWLDVIVLKDPHLIFSALPLILLLLFSSKRVPVFSIIFFAFAALIFGNRLAYIIFLPLGVFFAFLVFESLKPKYKLFNEE